MKKDLITVIVPVYNVAEYLPRCINSIINNTYTELEIICINDGSTDTSLEILQSFAKKDSRIEIIDKINGGLSSARNDGIKKASGEYVAFIDSDDWISEYYFEYLYTAIKDNNADIAVCNFTRTSNNSALDNPVHYNARNISIEEMFSSHKLKSYVWRRLYKASVIHDIWFDVNAKIEDSVYNLDVLVKNEKLMVAYVDEVLYAYFIREGSLVTKIGEKEVLDLANHSLDYCKREKRKEIRSIIAEDAIKRALSSRYVLKLKGELSYMELANDTLKEAIQYVAVNKKMWFWILYKCAWMYRLFRLLDDPTMFTYEKVMRQRYKQPKAK